jgi:hypothetical protein
MLSISIWTLICGCVNSARKLTPLERVMFLESKPAKTHTTHVWISSAHYKHARAIGLGEELVPTWPLGTHHVDGSVWIAWVHACANRTRVWHASGIRLGSQ